MHASNQSHKSLVSVQRSEAWHDGQVTQQNVAVVRGALQPVEGKRSLIERRRCYRNRDWKGHTPCRHVEKLVQRRTRLLAVATRHLRIGQPSQKVRHSALFKALLQSLHRIRRSAARLVRESKRVVQLVVRRGFQRLSC